MAMYIYLVIYILSFYLSQYNFTWYIYNVSAAGRVLEPIISKESLGLSWPSSLFSVLPTNQTLKVIRFELIKVIHDYFNQRSMSSILLVGDNFLGS